MQCIRRPNFLSVAKERLLDQALNEIQTTFHNQVAQIPSKELTTDWLYLPRDVRILELKLLESIKLCKKPYARGFYHIKSGKIFLNQGKWCWKTLLHETLHSVSNFSLEPNIDFAKRNKWLNDGLTEFITGYILFNRYPECYEAWKNKTFEDLCPVSYSPEVKFWGTFCQFIPIAVPAKLYFLSPSLTWRESYLQFIEDIRREIPNFSDVLSRGNILKITEFREACKNHFGKNFRKIEKTRKSLDFTRLC